MKIRNLIPEELFVVIRIANDTFGINEFTNIPSDVEEAYRQDPSGEFFWQLSTYCLCFFPKQAWFEITNDFMVSLDSFDNRLGFENVCKILDCSADDEIVLISVEDLIDESGRADAARAYLTRQSFGG